MSRKAILLGTGILLFFAATGCLVVLLLHREPDFYRRWEEIPEPERMKGSGQFVSEMGRLAADAKSLRNWAAQFQEGCINSYFAGRFLTDGLAQQFLAEGISDPRVAIEPERLRLAFRYGTGPMATVISVDLRIWLTKETNVVALELEGLHAGSLPVSAQSLLERVSETARQHNIEITWYRYHGNPVALVRLQADQERPTFRLQRLVLGKGMITVSGCSSEDVRVMLPTAFQPVAN